MANHRSLKLILVAVIAASLARAGSAGNVEVSPELAGLRAGAPALALPAAMPSGASLGFSLINVPATPAVAPRAQAAAAAVQMGRTVMTAPLAKVLPKGDVRRTIAAFGHAVSDPKSVGATIASVFDGGSAFHESDADESGVPAQVQAQLDAIMERVNAQAAKMRVGRFGMRLRAEFRGDNLAITAKFTLDGQTLTPEKLQRELASGRIKPAEWKRAQQVLGQAAQALGQAAMASMQQGGPEAASAPAEVQEYLDSVIAQANEKAAKVRVGRFGFKLFAEFRGDDLAVTAGFTLDGETLSPERLQRELAAGRITKNEWQRAQQTLGQAAHALAQEVMEGLKHGDSSIARYARAKAGSVEGASFRTITGPGARGPEEPPHLAPEHFEGLVNELVAVDRAKGKTPSLKQSDVERLGHVLTTIDRMNVDPISAEAWAKTFEALGHAAKHAFHPEKYDWSKTVTLLLKMAVRRLLDLHSAYWDTKEFKAINDQINHSFAGIGLQYVASPAGLVMYVEPEGPARKAGLELADKIVSIDGVPIAQIADLNGKLASGAALRVVVERERQLQPEIVLPAGAGAGVRVVEDSDFGKITYVAPSGPAQKAGVKVGDKVISMNDVTLTRENPMAFMKLRGDAGSTLKVVLERGGQRLPPMDITRADVDVPNVFSKMVAPQTGYVYLAQFSPDAGQAVFSEIAKLREQGAAKLVLDLRNNPGGDVNAVSAILAAFFKDGERIMSFKRQGALMFANITDGDGAYSDMPVAVLVNGHSASGSEATSGAMQDVRGKVVVGTRTYGKGTMQTTEPDEQGRGLHLTQARWYTPADRNIDAQRDPAHKNRWVNLKGTGGVVPDHEVPLPKDHEHLLMEQIHYELKGMTLDRPKVGDPQLEKAIELLSGAK